MAAFEVFEDVVTWRNHITSLACLVGVNLLYFLIFVANKCLLSLCCWLSLFVMALGLVLKGVDTTEVRQGNVEVICKETIEDHLLSIYDWVNDWASTLRDIVLWRDVGLSGKIAAITFVVGYVGSFFSLATLSFLLIWAVFSGSLIMQQYKLLVEPTVQPIIWQVKAAVCRVISSIPKMDDVRKAA